MKGQKKDRGLLNEKHVHGQVAHLFKYQIGVGFQKPLVVLFSTTKMNFLF